MQNPYEGKPVVGIGAATWDDLWILDILPYGEGVAQAKANAQSGGGPVATALCVLSLMGRQTILFDSQGDDPFASRILADLKDRKVDTSRIRINKDHNSSHAMIVVRRQDGARNISFLPASGPELTVEDLDESVIRNAALLHINGRHEKAARQAVKWAKESGVPVSFDGGAGRWRESLRDLVLASDIRIVAWDFAKHFANSIRRGKVEKLMREGEPKLVAITRGKNGSDFWTPKATYHQPAIPSETVLDTTGCGDVFHGAVLHGWLAGWRTRESAAFAAAFASKTAEVVGGRAALTPAIAAECARSAQLSP